MQKDKAEHIIPAENKTYNERLFKSGIRKYFHEARFFWLQKTLKHLKIAHVSILELGCYDGKLLSYLPFLPLRYDGYDANWENGLELAKTKWIDFPDYHFFYCNHVAAFNPQSALYDITVSMETLEHLPLADLDAYLLKINSSTREYFFLTVPNEKGPLVLLKYAIKKLFLKVDEPYSLKELMQVSIGRTSKVERKEFGHKGFDYQQLITALKKHFDIVAVQPIPFSFLPAFMNFSIGIIARPLSHGNE